MNARAPARRILYRVAAGAQGDCEQEGRVRTFCLPHASAAPACRLEGFNLPLIGPLPRPHARPPRRPVAKTRSSALDKNTFRFLLTCSLVLLYMGRCFTYEEILVHSAGEGGDLFEGVFGFMFDIMFALTCSFSRALFFIHARLLPNASAPEGDWWHARGAAAERSLGTPEGSPPLS